MRLSLIIGAIALLLAAPVRAQVVLSVSSWLGPSHPLSRTQSRWCDEVAKATARRVTCRSMPRPVSDPTATFDAVRDGLADVSYSVHGYTPGRFQFTQMVELPFGGDSAEAMSVAYQRVFQRHLAALGEHQGLKVLAVFVHGPGMVFNTRLPIRQLSDMQDLKFRVGGGIVSEIGKALGLNVTVRPATETYDLLASGRFDGVFLPAETIDSFRLEKLVRHRTAVPGGLYNTSFALVMNEATWRRIAPADQAAIDAMSGEITARAFGRSFDAADRRALAFMQANGVQVSQATRAFLEVLHARTVPVEQRWVRDAKARGLANADAVLREYRAEVARLK
ncbi:MAG TPA: TRAP transporter substrate-binding protein [Burkholderiaceae bacterium]|nr:TRAP transporter substrate-binding protein [Burkholderiaceae bacterium]